MVEEVEEVHAELEVEPLVEDPILGELHVNVAIVRTEAVAAGRVANGADSETGEGEGAGVQDLLTVFACIAASTGDVRTLVVAEARTCERGEVLDPSTHVPRVMSDVVHDE